MVMLSSLRSSAVVPILLVTSALLSACATMDTGLVSPGVGDTVEPHAIRVGKPIGDTAAGNFLAGQVAQREGDWQAASAFINKALADDPGNEALMRRAFLLSLGAGNYQIALDQARGIATQSKPLDLALVLLLVDAADHKNLDQARQLLEKIGNDGLQTILKPGIDAWLLAGEGDTDQALEVLDQFKSYGGFEALIALHRALILDYAGRVEAAEAAYRQSIELSPTLRAGHAYGSFLARHDRIDEAEKLFARYKARDGSLLLASGLQRLQAGDIPTYQITDIGGGIAAMLFDLSSVLGSDLGLDLTMVLLRISLYSAPDAPLAQLLLGDLLTQQRQYDAAEAVYDAIPADSDIILASAMRHARLLEQADRIPQALKLLRAAARKFPDQYTLFARIGDLLRQQKDFTGAVTAYDQALALLPKVEPGNWVLFYTRGIAHERLGKWTSAEADFKRALELQPDQPYVLNYLGYSWADQGEHLAEAEAMIRKAVSLRPNDGFIVDSLGWVLYRLGRYAEAVDILEQAVALSPADQTINDHLGDAMWRVGRKLEAGFQWQRAVDLDEDPDVTKRARDKLLHGLPLAAPVSADRPAPATAMPDDDAAAE